MPIAWTDFEDCINDRIAHYQKQYDQATRIYQQLLQEPKRNRDQILDILAHQQMIADELSRLKRLSIKYAQVNAMITRRRVYQLEKVRLN